MRASLYLTLNIFEVFAFFSLESSEFQSFGPMYLIEFLIRLEVGLTEINLSAFLDIFMFREIIIK